VRFVRVKRLYGEAYRSYEAPFSVTLPESGLTLVKGVNLDTGDTSDSGKSSLMIALAYLFGGCPYPATELQCWHTKKSMMVGAEIDAGDGVVTVERRKAKGLTLTVGGEAFRGGMAEERLDRVFGGMTADLRAATTYCEQDKVGQFLSLSDEDKKSYLAQLVPGLAGFEEVAEAAARTRLRLQDVVAAEETAVARSEAGVAVAMAALAEADRLLDDVDEPSDPADSIDHDALIVEATAIAARAQAAYQDACTAWKDPQRESETASIDADERTLGSAEGSPALNEARAELAKLEERLKVVEAADAERRVEVERAAGARRIRVLELTTAAGKATGLRSAIVTLRDRLRTLRERRCYTCGQDWQDAAALKQESEIESQIVTNESELKAAEEASTTLGALKAEPLPVFDPHPFLQRLRDAVTAAQALVEREERAARSETETRREALQERRRGTNDRSEARRRAATAGLYGDAQEATAYLQSLRDGQEEARILADEVSKARALWKERSDAAERQRARLRTADSELETARGSLAEARSLLQFEDDVAAFAGRSGFLGAMVRDVLGQVADTTNDTLAGIANVRHAVFRFSPDPELKRIVPTIVVDGEARPLKSAISGGQATAVKLTVDLAFGLAIAERRGVYPGWLCLDESFNGLGTVSKEAALEVLARFASNRLVLCTDHASETTGLFVQTIETETIDRRSRIV